MNHLFFKGARILGLSALLSMGAVPLCHTLSAKESQSTPAPAAPKNKAHQKNPAVTQCLQNITAGCALTAAVKTVGAETQPMERVKVLVAVAESMITLGQINRANYVLTIADEDARSTGLSIALLVAIKDLVPLHARLGNYDKAFAYLSEVKSDRLKDELLTVILSTQAQQQKDIETLQQTANQLSNPVSRFFTLAKSLQENNVTLSEADLVAFETKVNGLKKGSQQFRGKAALAGLLYQNGQKERALALFDELDSVLLNYGAGITGAMLAASKLNAMAYAGMDKSSLKTMRDYTNKQSFQINATDDHADFAEQIGPVEVELGMIGSAMSRRYYFKSISDQSGYLLKLSERHQRPSRNFTIAISKILETIRQESSRYNRDLFRYQLLRVAYNLKDKSLMQQIIEATEDDDNQARALALMAGLYQ